MDRSLQSLPASLQAVTLYEAKGELIDAAGGLLEFSDLLKRPLDAFKYLQLSIETGEVALTAQNVQLNCVMMGSANELHLDAFREHAEFASFRGRLELARVPYLRSYEQERLIYDTHVAPAGAAARRAARDRDGGALRRLHADAQAQPRPLLAGGRRHRLDAHRRSRRPTSTRSGKRARAARRRRAEAAPGGDQATSGPRATRTPSTRGASARARARCASRCSTRRSRRRSSASTRWRCSTRSRRSASARTSSSGCSKTPIVGGYHDVKAFRETLIARLLAASEYELYVASGLVQEEQYAELFERYVQHVSVWVKKERLYNRVTRAVRGAGREDDGARSSACST